MKNRRNRNILSGICLFMIMALFSACGKKAEVNIDDRGVVTKLEVSLPDTVENILKKAEISLGAEDQTEPALGAKLEDAGKITVLRMNHVKLIIDGEEKEASLAGGTVKDLLDSQKITLGSNQSMNVKDTDLLKDGMEITIETAYGVRLTCDDHTEQVTAGEGTVADILKANQIELGEEDIVTPELSAKVTEGMEIVVKRVTYTEITETEILPFETEKKDSSRLEKGEEKVETPGENGEKTNQIRIRLVDGEEESRETISEEITKEPVNEVILVGTKEKEKVTEKPAGKVETQRVAVPNCDDPSHGYYEIYYSDGSVEYVEY